MRNGTWSDEEKRNLIKGLHRMGGPDRRAGYWEDMARLYVKTRTRAQLASFYQKWSRRPDESAAHVPPQLEPGVQCGGCGHCA